MLPCRKIVNTIKDYMKRLHFDLAFLKYDGKATKSRYY